MEIRPPSEQLIEYLAPYDVRVGELALMLREIVISEAPDANEIVFRSYTVSIIFSYTEKWTGGFCYVALATKHVNLGLIEGARLDDPEGVLEGEGKQMRHIKIKKTEDLKKPYLRKFIRAAIKLCKSDLAEKTKKAAKTKANPSAKKRSGKTKLSAKK